MPPLTPTPGSRFGPYDIVSVLGAGGMGEVYRARDARLNRDVAIKVLLPSVANDPERLARFTREAQSLAALNHPNIAHIHGLEESGTARAIVMELVEGDDLSTLIARGPMRVADVLPIARQIADALEAAHEQGIVHRDLKPANVKVRHDGTVKVLDFGLAKAREPAGVSSVDLANSPTLTRQSSGEAGTQAGVILGTVAYMAPEQAKGKPVDKRADIWAFGVVLYEMLTGQRAFKGDDVSEVLASVLRDAPDFALLPADTPASVRQLLARCLERDPRKRLRDIGDAKWDLNEATSAPGPIASARASVVQRTLPWAIAALLAVALVAAVGRQWMVPVSNAAAAPYRFPIELPPDIVPNRVPTVLLSADGTRLVYSALRAGQLVLVSQKMGELNATPIAGSEGAYRPFLSPDGKWVAFSDGRKLLKVTTDGGTPVTIGTALWGGGSWGADGRIVYSRTYQEGLWEMDESSGRETMLTTPDSAHGELAHWWPQVLPDGDHILFTAYRAPGDTTIEVFSRKTKTRTVLVKGAICARYIPSGHLVYAKEETLFAVRIDLATLTVKGAPAPVVADVATAHGAGYAAYDVAANGTLVYLPASSFDADRDLVLVNRTGGSQLALPDPGRYDHPSLSPDETRIALDVKPKGSPADVWVFPVGSARGVRITDNPGEDLSPLWTKDGRELIYLAERPLYELWRRSADASEPPRQVIGGGNDRIPNSISADDRLVAYLVNVNGRRELRTLPLQGEPKESTYLAGVLNSAAPSLSPDGRWIAYQSEETGRVEVYVQSFPDRGRGRWKVSTNGASEPLWTRGGREVVFRERDAVIAVTVNPDGKEIGAPQVLFRGPYVYHEAWDEGRSYDVSRDGEKFLMLRERPEQRRNIVATLNWIEDLKTKAPH